jgi:beta-N-acetylhexosaminidase
VGDLVAAYIRGAKIAGMLTTAKHFPGHGDTATDSHLGVAKVNGDLARLQSVELPPFRKAIEAGVDAIMVAHVTAPALEPDPNKVGTTSSAIVTNLLKNQLGFTGLVVTDAIDMAGVTRLYAQNIGRAAVDAFKAGNDLLLIPADLDASYKAMLDAVRSREIPEQRINASVLKLLKAKASLGLQKARLVDVDAIPKLVAQPANVAAGQQAADDAVTLVRDNGRLLPLKHSGTVSSGLPYQAVEEVRNRIVAVILTEDLHSDAGRTLARQLRIRVPDANVIYVDPRTVAAAQDSILKAAGEAQAVIAAVYVIPTAGKVIRGPNGVTNSVSLADATGSLLENLLSRAGEKTAVVAMGNPYVASDFPSVQNYLCTFSNATVSEVSAVKALFGEIPIRGHLPVTIPNIAQRGAGIERPVLAASGGSHVQTAAH